MLSKNDLDVNKIRYIYTDSVSYVFDSVIVATGGGDITLKMHAATGSRNTYMIKNVGATSLTLTFDAADVLDLDITTITIFPYESYLITDVSPQNWLMLDFHILWMFGWPPVKF